MDKEYSKNQRSQKKSFKEYRKHMIRAGISIVLALLGTFAFPSSLVVELLKGFGEYVGVSVAVWSKILLMAGGTIGTIVNGIKAKKVKDKIDDLNDLEEEIVEKIVYDKEKLEQKNHDLEKTKLKEEVLDQKTKYERKDNYSNEVEEEKRLIK